MQIRSGKTRWRKLELVGTPSIRNPARGQAPRPGLGWALPTSLPPAQPPTQHISQELAGVAGWKGGRRRRAGGGWDERPRRQRDLLWAPTQGGALSGRAWPRGRWTAPHGFASDPATWDAGLDGRDLRAERGPGGWGHWLKVSLPSGQVAGVRGQKAHAGGRRPGRRASVPGRVPELGRPRPARGAGRGDGHACRAGSLPTPRDPRVSLPVTAYLRQTRPSGSGMQLPWTGGLS